MNLIDLTAYLWLFLIFCVLNNVSVNILEYTFLSFLNFFLLITEEFIYTGCYQLGNNICFKYSFQLVLYHLAL